MISNKADLSRYIRADVAAAGLGDRWRPQYRISGRNVYFVWLLRRSEYYANCRPDWLGRIVGELLHLRVMLLGERLGYEIHRNVFGPGLCLVHAGTVVVSAHAKVGSNCRIHPDMTIGESRGAYPTIGDDVWIGPGARIVGGVIIGDRVAIGANAVVVTDVPNDVTVAGIPARVVDSAGVSHTRQRQPSGPIS